MNSGAAVLDKPMGVCYSHVPNEITARAIREARAGIGVKYFPSASEMFEELDDDNTN